MSAAATPGYGYRLRIWFTTDRRGKRTAYYWSYLTGRAIRLPYADAEIMRATGTADVICCHPLRECTHARAAAS